MPNRYNYHSSAADLIVAAAEKSGLLREVAEALHWYENFEVGKGPPIDCLPCLMLEELAEEFGEHCSLPGYDAYGEGFCIPPATDAEVAPYLGKPAA